MSVPAFQESIEHTLDRVSPVHPWLRGLSVFGVPFICYGRLGEVQYTSPSARRLITDRPSGIAIERQAETLIASLSRNRSVDHSGPDFILIRTTASAVPGLYMTIYESGRSRPGVMWVVLLIGTTVVSSADISGTGLSARERDVAACIAAGLTTKEIARELTISAHTVRHHTERIFAKLGVRSRAAVAAQMNRPAHHM